ncbi:MAG: arginine--tRNA ligase [Acidobacteria bacterium]|nr:arginine--tRNA ligase [Acidobacteriota bacterium]
MLGINEIIKDAIRSAILDRYGIEPPSVILEHPPSIEMGDLATPIAFSLAKSLKKPPRKIAEELLSFFSSISGISKVEVAGSGYINFFLDRADFLRKLISSLGEKRKGKLGVKVIVEHSSINPNKAAHIGHLRNACLGDTLARLLRFLGEEVEVQNYIDDTGVQVADVVFGFKYLEGKSLEEVEKISERFDYYCWDLYSKVTSYLAENKEEAERRAEVLKEIEEGEGEIAEMASYIAKRIVLAHLKTMERINIHYDLLPWEGDIIRLKFWEQAFELLKERGAVYLATSGKNKGCFVMDLSGSDEFAHLEDKEKVLVRSNGTVTYVGKDIAYHMWKFGLLGRDFFYRKFYTYPDGKVVFRSSSQDGEERHPSFGKGERVYNVIDVRQSYPQMVVKEGLRSAGYKKEAEGLIHFSYEMVALTPSCARELGLPISPEEEEKPYIEMSGRKGLGVKADDLIDKLEEKARLEVRSRNPELSPDELAETARDIAVGALRYFMIKYGRNRVISFDFDEALNFEGESGPYIQYAAVRAKNILRKLEERFGVKEDDLRSAISSLSFRSLEEKEEGKESWRIILDIARLPEVVSLSVSSLEPSQLAKYAFNLAQEFNSYYHKYPVINEKDEERRLERAVLVFIFKEQLIRTLSLMGISVPKRM